MMTQDRFILDIMDDETTYDLYKWLLKIQKDNNLDTIDSAFNLAYSVMEDAQNCDPLSVVNFDYLDDDTIKVG